AVRAHGLLPLVRRARHALPAAERAARARLADVRVARPLLRAPVAGARTAVDAAFHARHHTRLGAGGLGAPPSREMGRGDRRRRAGGFWRRCGCPSEDIVFPPGRHSAIALPRADLRRRPAVLTGRARLAAPACRAAPYGGLRLLRPARELLR